MLYMSFKVPECLDIEIQEIAETVKLWENRFIHHIYYIFYSEPPFGISS
jgi:hypothetical protein